MLRANLPGDEPLRLSDRYLPSRREILKAGALGVASLAALSVPGCAVTEEPNYQPSEWYLELDDGTQVFVKDLLPPSGAPQATIIFAHGFNGSHADWSLFLPNAQVRILAFDAPGHGNSEFYRTGTHSPQRNAEIFVKLLEKADSAAPAMIAGHSMGGMEAAAFAAAHPDFDGRLVLINSCATPLDTPLVHLGLDAIRASGLDADWKRAMAEYVEAMRTFDVISELPKSKARWLIVGSRFDEIIPYDAERLIATVLGERAEFLELAGGHMPALWNMQTLRDALLRQITALYEGQ